MMSEQIVYGIHAVDALLSKHYRPVKLLYVNRARTDARVLNILKCATDAKIPVELQTTEQMKKRFADVVHQGVVAIAGALPQYSEADLDYLLTINSQRRLILILDGVTDPHNLGACLRSADAAGVDFVIIPKDKNANITPVVSKVACGAAEAVPLVRVTNLARVIEKLQQQGVWIYGAAGDAETSIYQIDFTGDSALIMGAEGTGMRRLTREHCDGLFALPMLGAVSSLNVSVATGVCLYEVVRQRQHL